MANTTDFAVEKPTPGGYRNTWGGTINTGFDKLTELLALALPSGTIQRYPKTTAPTSTSNGGEWLICAGGALDRTGVYAPLYAVIGTNYGIGTSNNLSTFSLPDLRSRVPVGYNTDSISGRSTRDLAIGSGAETHTLLDAEIPKHTHGVTDPGHPHNTTETAHSHTGSTSNASTSITIADHTHKSFGSDGYVVYPWHNSPNEFIQNGSGIDGDRYGPFRTGTQLVTGPGATPITDPGHPHSIGEGDLDTTATELTIDSATTGITVNEQGTGDTAHNIMQPYLVVNYIILAKHPTF